MDEPSPSSPIVRVARAADLAAYIDVDLAPSRWRVVTQDDVDRFVALTGDANWIHTDVAGAARELDGGRTVVPGQLLLALVPALLQEVCVVASGVGSREAALSAVRFRHAVHPGDAVRLRARLTLVARRPRFVQVDAACDLELASGRRALTSRRTDVFFE